jgi:hypothetical protein
MPARGSLVDTVMGCQRPGKEPVNAKQKWHLQCETEMSCFGSENAFDRLAIYFRAFSFPNRNHEDDNFLVYNLVYKAIA